MGGAAAWFAKHRERDVTMGSIGFDPSEQVQMSVHAEALDDSPPPEPPAPPELMPPEEIHPTMGAVAITPELEAK